MWEASREEERNYSVIVRLDVVLAVCVGSVNDSFHSDITERNLTLTDASERHTQTETHTAFCD